MTSVYLISACRTPIGKFLGGLSTVPAPELGGAAIREAIKRAGVDADRVDEVIMGNVLQAGVGQAPARQAALKAGLPETVAAFTVNKVCGSGLKAVMCAAQAIKAGDASIVVAGGMESMSLAPFLLKGARAGMKFGEQPLFDHMQFDGLTCAFDRCAMGSHAEWTARTGEITRAEQDRYSAQSQKRAAQAWESGWFQDEIVPVAVGSGKRATTVDRDEGVRPETTVETLAKLSPAFDPAGTVTAGNASTLSDGASALVCASEEYVKRSGISPMARIVSYATSGGPPKELFLAPINAVKRACDNAKIKVDQIDLFEINEAFASQTIACARGLAISEDRLNVQGGGIAIGHPIGASGARVLTTLLYAMKRRNDRRGCASLCLGGGNAVALIVELV